jgi:hypothetical protein
MRKSACCVIILLATIIICACSDDYIAESNGEELIVEGWIKEGESPVVMLTTSIEVDMNAHSIDDLYNHIGSWGRVVVSDGEKSVVLTGQYDFDYYPPYIYTTTDIKGETGKVYTLDVVYNKHHAMASTTIPPSVKVDSITQTRVENNDTLWTLQAHFTAPGGKCYYSLFDKIGANEQQFIKCDVGTFDNSAVNPDMTKPMRVTYPVYRTKTLDDYYGVTEYFVEGDTVCVELCTMDSTSFNIWQDYQNIISLSGNMFVPYSRSIRTNVTGGHGYWCGYGKSQLWSIIGRK